eukprot:GHVS01105506.1.p2 GENE.GHVS01105506.1~~GHVS01105506.1.p2  ORF type:complete len:184 (+),score=21.52 GHVS01105506.1:164-715(+)
MEFVSSLPSQMSSVGSAIFYPTGEEGRQLPASLPSTGEALWSPPSIGANWTGRTNSSQFNRGGERKCVSASGATCWPPSWWRSRSAEEIFEEAVIGSRITEKLPIGVPAMDRCLRGGVPSGCLVEFVGEAGSGKTQTCLTLTAQVSDSTSRGVKYGSLLHLHRRAFSCRAAERNHSSSSIQLD